MVYSDSEEILNLLLKDYEPITNPKCILSFKDLLIKATYHNNYDLVVKLLDSDEFEESILNDIGLLNKPFPLYYITMCYRRTMWENFIDAIMPFVMEQRAKITKLLKLWQERFGVDVESMIDYKKYGNYFYCSSDDETEEDILFNSKNKYADNGCRNIDIDLFIAVEKFQFALVKDLLLNGANPNANLLSIDDNEKDYEDPFNCFDRIGGETSYLCSCKIFPSLILPLSRWYLNSPVNDNEIGDLIGWAAHEDMYKLLKKYYK